MSKYTYSTKGDRGMMTLDEVISSFEKAADYDCYNDEQRALAAEYAQIAEWLRELKKLKEEADA